MNERLDVWLVEHNYFETRNKSQSAIKDGLVFCNGKKTTKCGCLVNIDTLIEIKGNAMPYVSKGGLKLEKALKEFHIDLTNKVMLDIGSSTGGFTDCALQNGIGKVIAVDVGTNQFDKKLLPNSKIELYEKTDFRNIDDSILSAVEITTIDVSFISVIKLLPKLSLLKRNNEIICLIKPQFECGKEIADKYKGIILNKNVHKQIISNIICEFKKINFKCLGLTNSPILGGSGNIEYLAYFVNNNNNSETINFENIILTAFNYYKIVEKK